MGRQGEARQREQRGNGNADAMAAAARRRGDGETHIGKGKGKGNGRTRSGTRHGACSGRAVPAFPSTILTPVVTNARRENDARDASCVKSELSSDGRPDEPKTFKT